MALYSCADCSHQVSNKAISCPGCGRMVRARWWWATTIGWGVIFSAIISFLLVSVLYALLLAVLGPLYFMR